MQFKTETFRVLNVAYVKRLRTYPEVGEPRPTRLTACACMLSDTDG